MVAKILYSELLTSVKTPALNFSYDKLNVLVSLIFLEYFLILIKKSHLSFETNV